MQKYMNDQELQNLMMELLYPKYTDLLPAVIEASINSIMESEEKDNRQKLFNCLSSNKDGLVLYYRHGDKMPPINEG